MKKINLILRLAAIMLAACFCFGCTSGGVSITTPDPNKPTPDPEKVKNLITGEQFSLSAGNVSKAYIDSLNSFSAKMLQELGSDWTGVASPLSVQLVLSLLANGLSDEAQQRELLSGICYDGELNELNVSAMAFINSLTSPKKDYSSKNAGIAKFTLANAVFTEDDREFNSEFVNNAYNYYGAELGNMDFSIAANAIDAINSWASEKTNGLIDQLISAIPDSTRSVLLNALYFNAEWSKPFTAYKGSLVFHGLNGDTMRTMLRSTGEYSYGKFADGEMLILPYSGNDYSMAIVLPSESRIPSESMAALMGKWDTCEMRQCSVTMPQLKLETNLDMLPILAKMGFEDLTSGNMSFDRILKDSDLITDMIIHGAALNVTEKGTEAGAATIAALNEAASEITDDPIEFICDRPYAMAIFNNETGAVIFVSVVNDLVS